MTEGSPTTTPTAGSRAEDGPAFDPERYKAEQRQLWSAAASGWNRWWETFEKAAQRVSDRLVDLARVGPGGAVLDVGTGIGEPAITAARRVGPTGRVVAIDQSPQMLGLARRRMASLGLTNLEFLELDAERLQLGSERFDAVVSRWGLMFLPDLDRVLQQLHEVLSPGGRLAVAVWSSPENVPLINLANEVARQTLQVPPPPEGTPTPFALADRSAFEDRLARAGFEQVSSEPLSVTFEFSSPEEYASFVLEVSGSMQRVKQDMPEKVDELASALASAATRFTDPGVSGSGGRGRHGRVRMENQTICVVAQRPRSSDGPSREDSSPHALRNPHVASNRGSPDMRENHSIESGPAATRQVRCPFCGSRETKLESAFGSTLGFAQYWCAGCRTGFEYLKWEDEQGAV